MVQLSTKTCGRALGKNLPAIVFVAGFPDDHGSWAKLTPRFQDSHHVVTVVLPDYDKPRLSPGHYWGYTFDEIIAGLADVLADVKERAKEVVLVGHDWGSMVRQLLADSHPDLVTKLVLLDVGQWRLTKMSSKNIAVVMAYQLHLLCAFFISRMPFIGGILATVMIAMFPWKTIGPCPFETEMPSRTSKNQTHFGHMCYPYLYFTLRILRGEGGCPSFPRIPVLFLYGKRKRGAFHDDQFLRTLSASKGCSWKELDCGHFMQVQVPDDVEAEIRKFVAM